MLLHHIKTTKTLLIFEHNCQCTNLCKAATFKKIVIKGTCSVWRGLFELAQQASSAGAASARLFDTFAVYFL